MIYDISPLIDENIKVWPGDTPPSREIKCTLEEGASVDLSTLHTTVHLGAHADAPSHYGEGAPSIAERDPEYYWGRAQVIRVSVGRGKGVKPEDIRSEVTQARVLIATGTYPDASNFNEDFASLSAELVDFLKSKGVKTVGIDTPSVDLFHSKDLPVHNALLRNDMANLEGLMLGGVPEGVYEMAALPLKLKGFDASPVRAVLRTVS